MVPLYVTRDELDNRIVEELRDVAGPLREWWESNRTEPFILSDGTEPRFVLARDGTACVHFDDNEDEFATGVIHNDQIAHVGLCGELRSAIYNVMHNRLI
ncbi:hypothetical protein [Stieleria varia]|uniref:hypothetical protein n=1 Tax=Stieleria varia TaxID=2528005 RepID=UPI0011B465EC|nr:hypothetical protein [Stieleria varia]